MIQLGFHIRTASTDEMFLKDLPEGVTLLPHNFEGATTRVMLKFAVSQQAVNNKNFDLIGFIKARLNNTLTAIRHRRNIKELRLTRRLRVVIDSKSGHKKSQIYFHIEYAKEHAIGERFEIDHIIYEVRPAHTCQGCSLYIEDEKVCLDCHGRFGLCSGNNRSDGQDVKFVQVGEVNIDK